MQELYACQTDENRTGKSDPVKNLQKQLTQCKQLFIYLLHCIVEVARYAETDARIRSSKNLPSAEDLNVNTRIAGNQVLWKILESSSFKRETAGTMNFEETADHIKRLYNKLKVSEQYQNYIALNSREKKSEKDILVFIFSELILPDEPFINHIEDHFSNWDDDAEMMDQLMLSYLQKPETFNLSDLIGDEKTRFAKELLMTTLSKGDYAVELIKPKLKNWDSDRIAVLDMILMQMGVCEFLYFETIPPKVTINEYIDIAKEYSTEQSGHFINGILDTIHKELLQQNKINKIDFKQKA